MLDEETKKKANEGTVAQSRPQIIAVRGGSLGFPAPAGGIGVQAGVDSKTTGGRGLSTASAADVFAKLGGLQIWRFGFEIMGEGFQADSPQVASVEKSTTPVNTLTSYESVGFRVRYSTKTAFWATHRLSLACLQQLQQKVETAKTSNDVVKTLNTVTSEESAKSVSDCTDDERDAVTRTKVLSLTAGFRLVKRGGTDESLTDLSGVQWEAGVRQDSEGKKADSVSWSWMASMSGMHLNQVELTKDDITMRYVRSNDVRISGAFEIRDPATATSASTKAIGAYGTLSIAWWRESDTSKPARHYQLEGGVYATGAFRGFGGTVAFSVIKPYDEKGQPIFALSVFPFAGAAAPGRSDTL